VWGDATFDRYTAPIGADHRLRGLAFSRCRPDHLQHPTLRVWLQRGKSSMSASLALLSEVKDAVANGSVHRRNQMLRHITDLFVVSSAACSDGDLALFDDVFVRLTSEIELSARALLAVRLAPIRNAPANIIRKLAFDDEIDVAAPVLEQSERLDDKILVENAKAKGQGHLFAISRRRSLSPEVTDVLVARGDQQVVQSTTENHGARFSDAGFAILVRRAHGDDGLAARVGSRPEIPRHLFLKLLAKASDAVRAKLEAAHPDARPVVRQVVVDVAGRIRTEVIDQSSRDAVEPGTIEALHRSSPVNDRDLAAIAKDGRSDEVCVALALMSKLSLEFVERAMSQERAETILIIARAIGLSWPTVKAILSVRDANGQAVARELAQCRASFERLISGTAREIIHYYRLGGNTGKKTN
jgi:uncharacterized protein (DUF2336 family)